MDAKLIAVILASIVGVLGFISYVKGTLKSTTKPHAFSWLIWGLLNFIAFYSQYLKGGGLASFVTFGAGALCMIIFTFALIKGERNFDKSDWIALAIAIFSISLWFLTDSPTLTNIILVFANLLGYIPTFKKAYEKPNEENALTFSLNSLRFIFVAYGLDAINFNTFFYPASIFLMDFSLVLLIKIRQSTLNKKINLSA